MSKLPYYVAMTDNRDIDEILASLDALLREGNSHNDDMPAKAVEQVSDAMDANDLEVALEADIASMKSSVEKLLGRNDVDVADETDADEAVSDEVSDRQEGSMARVILTEDMMVENLQVSLPLAFSSEETHAANVEESVEKSRKESGEPVLEVSSLDDVDVSDVEKNDVGQDVVSAEQVAAESLAPNDVTHLHKQEIEQLLSLVTQDISNHLQQMLPKLIKDSLHAHLADMQHESDKNNKTSDDE